MSWGLRRNVGQVWLEMRYMGDEVRGPRGVSSSDVMRERNKDVHYSIFSNCLSEFAQSCPTLCDPMDCSLPGSSIHLIA